MGVPTAFFGNSRAVFGDLAPSLRAPATFLEVPATYLESAHSVSEGNRTVMANTCRKFWRVFAACFGGSLQSVSRIFLACIRGARSVFLMGPTVSFRGSKFWGRSRGEAIRFQVWLRLVFEIACGTFFSRRFG